MSGESDNTGAKQSADSRRSDSAADVDVKSKLGGELLSTPPSRTDAADVPNESPQEAASSGHGRGGGHSSAHGHHSSTGRAHHSYASDTNAYWSRIQSAKSHHKYVTDYPPVYPGIDKPRSPDNGPEPIPKGGTLPSLNDVLSASKDLNRIAFKDGKSSDFVVSLPDEDAFKLRYSQEAVHVGSQFGMGKEKGSGPRTTHLCI